MIDYIKGKVTGLSPAFVLVENQGIGYFLSISLSTFTKLDGKSDVMILVHEVIKEDSHQLFGFADNDEREIFRMLISVSGVGAGTARMMLSSLSPSEIEKAILSSEVSTLKGVKGIGLKTAQRIILDLKDKLGKQPGSGEIFSFTDNTKRDEALSALVMLGFGKNAVIKVLDSIIRVEKNLSVEDLIKRALKNL